MEIRVLNYFLTVVQEGSITQAAQVLHMTQPTLSRQLSAMEEELGVKLFKRGSRKITLTEQGILLKRRAEEIIRLVEKAEGEVSQQTLQVGGSIHLGVGISKASSKLMEILKAFHEKYPQTTFEVETTTTDQILDQLDQGLLDFGLTLDLKKEEHYNNLILSREERWGAFLSPDHPLACKNSVTASELAQYPLIFPSRMVTKGKLANWFGDEYNGIHSSFSSNLTPNALRLIEQSDQIYLGLKESMPFMDESKVQLKPLEPSLTSQGVLLWKRDLPISNTMQTFITFAREYLESSTPD